MKKLFLLSFVLVFLWSCGGNGGSTTNTGINEDSNIPEPVGGIDSVESLDILDTDPISNNNISAAVSGFCDNQKKLQILSTSLLSAYAAKGNGADTNFCGTGTAELIEDGMNFELNVADYCVNARGQQVTLNADISGMVESGANFTSDIHSMTIEGNNIDLDISGITWDGRADDMFLNLDISDLTSDTSTALEYVNIKKGEFDFGYLNLPNVGRFKFKFIDHFNADNTTGMLFIYGEGEDYIVVSADEGSITAVYKVDRQDPGTLVTGTSCD
ncbi:MAG: hypothetical protein PVG89_00175 [Gammaproteobacteria bacterium]|jgi:hypothetical protein